MSRYGSGKSYGRRAAEVRSSLKFDQLLSENTNKPSTAKVSVAGGHRWGMASFTSVRKTHANGGKDHAPLSSPEESNKRIKMGIVDDDPFSFDCDGSTIKPTAKNAETAYPKPCGSDSVQKSAPTTSKPNKFFKSSSASRSRPLAVQNTINKPKYSATGNTYYSNDKSNSFATTDLKKIANAPVETSTANAYSYDNQAKKVPGYDTSYASNNFHTDVNKPMETSGVSYNYAMDDLNNSKPEIGNLTNVYGTYVPDHLSKPNEQSYQLPIPKVTLNLKVPSAPYIVEKPQQYPSVPVPVVNKRVSNDPFDLLLSSGPPLQQAVVQSQRTSAEFPSFSVERILSDDNKFASNGTTAYNHSDNFFTPPMSQNSQNDIFSLPTNQSFAPSMFSDTPDSDIFGSQSSTHSQYTANCYDSSEVQYQPSIHQPKTYATSYEDDFSVSIPTSTQASTGQKWSDWTTTNQADNKVAETRQEPEIFNPAFRTYGRNKPKPELGDSRNHRVNENHFDSGASTSTSGCGNAISRSQPAFDVDLSEAVVSGSEPLLQSTVSSMGDSQNSVVVLSDSAPLTDCSQESKESSQPDFAATEESEKNATVPKNNKVTVLKQKKIFSTPPKKNKPSYNPRASWRVEYEDHNETTETTDVGKMSLADEFEDDEEEQGRDYDFNDDEDDDEEDLALTSKLTLSKYVKKTTNQGEVITSWKCERSVKGLYTVVHNVKQAHQCHESGETQEFNDDVEYLLDGLNISGPLGTRCLSVLSWASKCMSASFRTHLRAHGTLSKVFSALPDAPNDPCLSLSTATLMFVLSQDRLTMDLDKSTLKLLLQLLECNAEETSQSSTSIVLSMSINSQQTEKIREKVRSLCEEMKQKGYAKELDLNNITTGILAMETFLSLSSRRTGEWFKEEIRENNGLEYLVENVYTGSQKWKEDVEDTTQLPNTLDQLKKLDRFLRVLENVTYSNKANQKHVLTIITGDKLVLSAISLLQLCRTHIVHHPIVATGDNLRLKSSNAPGAIIFTTIKTLLKVLINITHENALGSACVGSQEGILECVLLLILQTCAYIPAEERFDLQVLSFALLINFVEFCPENRERLVRVNVVGSYDLPSDGLEMSCVDAMIEVFVHRLHLAKQSEDQANALLDGEVEENGSGDDKKQLEGPSGSQVISTQAQVEQLEETLMKALHKAGKNMEHTIIASYISLLIGCIIENPDYREMIGKKMPNESFTLMIEVLRKFLNFVNLTGVVSNSGLKSIKRILDILESTSS